MTLPHGVNLAIHVGAGGVGIALGVWQLLREKGDAHHRRLGRWFIAAALTVTGSALVGLALFRFMPLFAVLAVLTTYVAVGGWRVAKTQSNGPALFDLLWTLGAMVVAAALLPALAGAPHVGSGRPVVVWSSLGALGVVLAYDLLRWAFPRRWHDAIWLPEHIYKVMSALSGMVSAFVGNVVRWGQPWSQLAPTVLGSIVMIYFIVRVVAERSKRSSPPGGATSH